MRFFNVSQISYRRCIHNEVVLKTHKTMEIVMSSYTTIRLTTTETVVGWLYFFYHLQPRILPGNWVRVDFVTKYLRFVFG